MIVAKNWVCDIYELPPGYVKCMLTQRPISTVIVDDLLVMEEKNHYLYTDFMHMDAN